MKKILLIFSLILGICCRPVFAEEEIVIIDSVATEGVYIGQTFPVGIEIRGAEPNTTFYYKFFGGIGDDRDYIQNNESLTYMTNWVNYPTFTTDSSVMLTLKATLILELIVQKVTTIFIFNWLSRIFPVQPITLVFLNQSKPFHQPPRRQLFHYSH